MTEHPRAKAHEKARVFFRNLFVLVVSFAFLGHPVYGENPLHSQAMSSSEHQLVILLDVNHNQKKVLQLELTLAEGVIRQLNQPQTVFSLITFGRLPPTSVDSQVGADEIIAALERVQLETKAIDNVSVQLREALNLALNQFIDNSKYKSILVISEGQDYFPGKTFRQTLLRAQQLQAVFYVAMVADHTFYGTKGIQYYGFDLRRLSRKTHGRYIEVGSRQKKIPAAVDRLYESLVAH